MKSARGIFKKIECQGIHSVLHTLIPGSSGFFTLIITSCNDEDLGTSIVFLDDFASDTLQDGISISDVNLVGRFVKAFCNDLINRTEVTALLKPAICLRYAFAKAHGDVVQENLEGINSICDTVTVTHQSTRLGQTAQQVLSHFWYPTQGSALVAVKLQ